MHVPVSFSLPYIGIIQTDWVIIGLLMIILVAAAVRWGTSRACVIAVTMPISTFLYSLMSESIGTSSLSSHLTSPLLQSLVFIGLLVFVYIMTHRMYRSYIGEGERFWLALLAGLATGLVVLVVWVHTPILASIWDFSAQTKGIFGPSYAFWWIVVSLFTLGYVRS